MFFHEWYRKWCCPKVRHLPETQKDQIYGNKFCETLILAESGFERRENTGGIISVSFSCEFMFDLKEILQTCTANHILCHLPFCAEFFLSFTAHLNVIHVAFLMSSVLISICGSSSVRSSIMQIWNLAVNSVSTHSANRNPRKHVS